MGTGRTNYRTTPLLGTEKRCTRCREWWPADREFFTSAPRAHDGLHSWCKACATESKQELRKKHRRAA